MRRLKLVPIILLATPTLFACGNKPTVVTHTITFNANGGTIGGRSTVDVTVNDGVLFSKVKAPVTQKEPQSFKHWTFDTSGVEYIDLDYRVTGDITVYAQYAFGITLSAPEDSSIVSYGSTVVSYSNESGNNITASSSDTSILKVDLDEDYKCIYVDAANGNVEGSAYVIVSDGTTSDSVKVRVHHPTSAQEAGEAIDFAIGRKIYNVTLTFNYNNQEEYEHFYLNRIECINAVPSVKVYYSKGENKTNTFMFNGVTTMATKYTDISLPQYSQYYCVNVKNGAYEFRRRNIVKRDDDHFFIDDAKKRLVVHNTETLFFALERGFRPVFDDSDTSIMATHAKQVYQKAREWCNEAFGKETTDPFMKMRQIFEYMTSHTHYDYWITSASDRPKNNGYEWMSYSPEGVFLNKGIAVCDGFSKAFAIMCGIEGLPVVRCAGFPDIEDLAGHAWNYYKYTDDKWYLVCPTWGQDSWGSDGTIFENNFATTNYTAFMTKKTYFKDTTYNKTYNECIYKEGMTEAQAKAEAEAASELMNFGDYLFSDFPKSSETCFANIYKQDSYATNCDYDIGSQAEATALANAMSFLNEDFAVDLSFNSWAYEDEIVNAMKAKFPSANINIIVEYSFAHSTLCVDF